MQLKTLGFGLSANWHDTVVSLSVRLSVSSVCVRRCTQYNAALRLGAGVRD